MMEPRNCHGLHSSILPRANYYRRRNTKFHWIMRTDLDYNKYCQNDCGHIRRTLSVSYRNCMCWMMTMLLHIHQIAITNYPMNIMSEAWSFGVCCLCNRQ